MRFEQLCDYLVKDNECVNCLKLCQLWEAERDKIIKFLGDVRDCADRPFLVADAEKLLIEMGEADGPG